MKYLLDTNICIYFLKGKYVLKDKFDEIGFDNLYISEITVAELKYGAEKSNYPDKNRKVIKKLSSRFKQIPIFNSLDIFAKEKTRLKKEANPLMISTYPEKFIKFFVLRTDTAQNVDNQGKIENNSISYVFFYSSNLRNGILCLSGLTLYLRC